MIYLASLPFVFLFLFLIPLVLTKMKLMNLSIFPFISSLIALYIVAYIGLMYFYLNKIGFSLGPVIFLALFVGLILDFVRKKVSDTTLATWISCCNRANFDMLLTCVVAAFAIYHLDSDDLSIFAFSVVFFIISIGSGITVLRNFVPVFKQAGYTFLDKKPNKFQN